MLAELREPIAVGGQDARVGASIGVAELAGHGTAEELLADADIAMYADARLFLEWAAGTDEIATLMSPRVPHGEGP